MEQGIDTNPTPAGQLKPHKHGFCPFNPMRAIGEARIAIIAQRDRYPSSEAPFPAARLTSRRLNNRSSIKGYPPPIDTHADCLSFSLRAHTHTHSRNLSACVNVCMHLHRHQTLRKNNNKILVSNTYNACRVGPVTDVRVIHSSGTIDITDVRQVALHVRKRGFN